MAAETPRQLGRYELLKRIAKGGMGEIYLARARGAAGFEKTCIIKTILPHLAEEEEFVNKFLDEGHIVVQLVHGNIVPVFDLGEEEGEYYLAMEYIPGRDLREILKKVQEEGEVMPVDLAVFVMSEVCKGLDYAHRKEGEDGESLGIIHRDVSPSNILISREGEVKLIDFGIARAAGRLSKTVSGRIQGKFCYMSPEQASGKPLDPRSDVFSAGVCLYEMLTNFRPFEGRTELESLDLVRKCDYDPPSTFNPAIPEEVDAIVEKALCKNREDRYETIHGMQVELLQHLYSAGGASTSPRLAEFLQELFPEGLEREELRSARGSGSDSASNEKMNLDEALDFELGKLSSGVEEDIDPLRTTAVSDSEVEEVEARGHTATLSTPTPADQSTEAESASQRTTAPDRPSAKEAVEEESGSDEAVSEAEGGDEAEDSAEASRETATEEASRADDDGVRGYKRALALTAIIGMFVGAAIVTWAVTRPNTGSVKIVSDPAGAQIYVDGSLQVGETTPAELQLEAGRHQFELEHDGYHRRKFDYTVVKGERRVVDGKSTKLRPLTDREPATFEVRFQPEDAVLFVDNERRGSSPQQVEVKPGSFVNLVWSHPRCDKESYPLKYDERDEEGEVTSKQFDLDCEAKKPDAGSQEKPEAKPEETTGNTSPPRMRITFDSNPSGATIFVNGEKLGAAPASGVYGASRRLKVRAEKAGYSAVTQELRARSVRGGKMTLTLEKAPTGCLNMRIMPYVGEVVIDGESLGSRTGLKRHRLPAGKHTVRVRNESLGKDVTLNVEIEPGDECAYELVNWKEVDKGG